MKTITLKTKEVLEQEFGKDWRTHGKELYGFSDWRWNEFLDDYLGIEHTVSESEYNLLIQNIPITLNLETGTGKGTIPPTMIVEYSDLKFKEAIQEFKNTPNKSLLKHLKDLDI